MDIHVATHQYLTFMLGAETYAIAISRVREVLEYRSVTKVPQMPEHILGVINLRGNSVPVMDLRTRLGMPASENTVNTCIIIVDIGTDGEQHIIGAVADSVREVMEILPDAVEPAPRIGTAVNSAALSGIGKQGDTFVMMLSTAKIFSDDNLVPQLAQSPEASEHAATL